MISQCVHLMSTLPTSDSFLKEVNTILYNFLWDGKPDKIKRSTTTLKHTHGGLKMINIYNFDRSLKVAWIKKLLTQSESQWCKLANAMLKGIEKIFTFGDQWSKKILSNIYNPFWTNVLENWIILNKSQKSYKWPDNLRSSLWHNSEISENIMFFSDWYKKGILIIARHYGRKL